MKNDNTEIQIYTEEDLLMKLCKINYNAGKEVMELVNFLCKALENNPEAKIKDFGKHYSKGLYVEIKYKDKQTGFFKQEVITNKINE